MSQNLWTAFIASNGSNQILVDSSPDGQTWTGSRFINQWSPFTPALAFFNGSLYIAFITDDVDSATGVPSNRIFVCSTSDGVSWTPATFINQRSKCAPALAVWGNTLYIAFIGNDPSNRILTCSCTGQSALGQSIWSGSNDTGQTSPQSPALVQNGDNLQMIFVSNDSRNAILVCDLSSTGNSGSASDTGQSTKFAPAATVFNNDLYIAFVADSPTNALLLAAPQIWVGSIPINQSSSAAPALADFNNINGEYSLFVAFAANHPSTRCLLTSSSIPSSESDWPSSDTHIQQFTSSGMALAIAPFASCAQLVKPSSDYPGGAFGGAHNYFVWTGPCSNPPSLPNLKLTIYISSDMCSTNGFSFQWNLWCPTDSNYCGWQQYGFEIDAKGNIDYYLENWATTRFTEVGGQPLKVFGGGTNIVDFRTGENVGHWYPLPPSGLPVGTLPAGYILTMELLYAPNSAAISGIACTVIDENGHVVANTGNIELTKLTICTNSSPASPVPEYALTPTIGFQLAVVGKFDGNPADFVSGRGTLVVSSPNSPLIAFAPGRPKCIYPFGGTGESSACVYSEMPDAPSLLMVQTFTV